MSTLIPEPPTPEPSDPGAHAPESSTPRAAAPIPRVTDPAPWRWLLAWIMGVVAAVDLVFFALIGEVIPPLAVGAALTVAGILLLRRAPRTALVVLGLTNLVMLAGALPFAVDHLGHPSSGIDFTHAVVGSLGRVLAVVATVSAWRRASQTGARRLAATSVGLAAATVAVAGLATMSSTGQEPVDGDVEVVIDAGAFPDRIEVAAGETLFVDNRDRFRHTLTVEGTDLDVDLPAGQGARATVDLPTGTYPVICAVPGHDFMDATLEVR